jgi:hypothetical protein
MFRPFPCCCLTMFLWLSLGAQALAAPIVTLTEVIDPLCATDPDNPFCFGFYNIATGDLEGWSVVGFAVDNSTAVFTLTTRTGWASDVLFRPDWDGGYTILFNTTSWCSFCTTDSSVSTGGGSATVATFDQYFIDGNRANLYWLAFDGGEPIRDFETAAFPNDVFAFWPGVENSNLLVFLGDPAGNVVAFSPSGPGGGSAVPEPATLGLLGLAAALAAQRHRTRARARR